MSRHSIMEYFKAIYTRYHKVSKSIKQLILNEFCANIGFNRKYAIRKLNAPLTERASYRRSHKRKPIYGSEVISVLAVVWEAAGYPCYVRLKALLNIWMPWIKERIRLSIAIEEQLLSISSRQIDRRLRDRKTQIRRGIYGRTKPGTLLKHHIPNTNR